MSGTAGTAGTDEHVLSDVNVAHEEAQVADTFLTNLPSSSNAQLNIEDAMEDVMRLAP